MTKICSYPELAVGKHHRYLQPRFVHNTHTFYATIAHFGEVLFMDDVIIEIEKQLFRRLVVSTGEYF